MYWIRKQISVHCGIVHYHDDESEKENKVYCGHFSDDRDHDQVYAWKCLDDIVSLVPVADALIIRSDNATHFKSAENFADLQDISTGLNKTVIQVYGVAGHCKCEIDSAGGHMKNPVRKGIANMVHISSDQEAVEYLTSHYEIQTNPTYHVSRIVSRIDPDELQAEREKRLYVDYQTVRGSDSFHVVVFKPESSSFLA